MPATQEPWLVAIAIIACYEFANDAKIAFSVLTAVVCAIYLLTMGFRLSALICARTVSALREGPR